MLDTIDYALLRLLVSDGRATWSRLASEVELTPPAATERVRKLERSGVIEGYSARIDPGAVGMSLLAFVSATASRPEQLSDVVEWAERQPEVQEMHIVAGSFDYVFKVRCKDSRHLDDFLRDELRPLPGIANTYTTITLRSCKESTSLPVAALSGDLTPW